MRPFINLLILVCIAIVAPVGFAQQAGTSPQAAAPADTNEADALAFPYIAEITGNDVHVRSGPGTNYYPCGKVNKGDRVTVVGSHLGGWSRIVPPPGSFSWISGEYVEVDAADPRTGVVTGNAVPVYVGSPDTEVIHSTKELQINRGEKVKLLGEKKDNYYKIAPPSGAYRWVSTRYTNPVGAVIEPPPPAVIPPEEPRETPAETPAETPVEKPAEEPSVAPSPAPASPSKLDQYYALESQLKAEQAKPIDQQNYDQTEEGLRAIAEDKEAGKAARYAQQALKQIQRCELALQVARLVDLQDSQLKKARKDISRAEEKRLAEFTELGDYVVVGWLRPFTTYGAGHYRVVDQTGKTICYAVPASQMDLHKYEGKKVGLVGTVEPHSPTYGLPCRLCLFVHVFFAMGALLMPLLKVPGSGVFAA
jgi:uncharacterized protein YgiM (DUF1202 family)